MTPTEIHLLRKTMALCTALIAATITVTAATVLLGLGGGGFEALTLLVASAVFTAIPWIQVSDGVLRSVYERLSGPPDTPYWSELREEVTLDV